MAPTSPPPITGRTARILPLGEGKIAKVYPPGQEAAAAREAAAAGIAHALGVPSPALFGTTEEQGHTQIIFGRLYGPSVLSWLGLHRPWRVAVAGTILAQVHTQLRAYHAPSLPSLRDALAQAIQVAAPVSPDIRARALQMLDTLPDADTLCHGDLTPANVLLTTRGPCIIDWAEAGRGDHAADIALSLLHLDLAYTYDRLERRPISWGTNRGVRAAYCTELDHVAPDDLARARQWLLPVAVARLARGAPVPPAVVLRLIRRYASRPELP